LQRQESVALTIKNRFGARLFEAFIMLKNYNKKQVGKSIFKSLIFETIAANHKGKIMQVFYS